MMAYKNRAQSLAEYVIILSITSAALVGMNYYVKRGINGRIKDMTNTFLATEQQYSDETASDTLIDTQRAPQQQIIAGRSITTTGSDSTTRTQTSYAVPEEFEDLLPLNVDTPTIDTNGNGIPDTGDGIADTSGDTTRTKINVP